jgi:hypothetical protein
MREGNSKPALAQGSIARRWIFFSSVGEVVEWFDFMRASCA